MKAARKPTKLEKQLAWLREMERLPGIFLPLRVTNPLNSRRHWRTVWSASRKARDATRAAVAVQVRRAGLTLPVTVRMTRDGPRSLDEGCGLNASLKPVRDGVADAFGVDDADKRYAWIYQQERAPFYGVRIEIETVRKQLEA